MLPLYVKYSAAICNLNKDNILNRYGGSDKNAYT